MSLEKVLSAASGADEVAAALRAASRDDGLSITAAPELNGAVVQACCVAVYVIVEREQPGFAVDCWHACATSPYKVVNADTLDDAVRIALAEFDNL